MRIYNGSEDTPVDLTAFRKKVGVMTVADLKVKVKVVDARLRFGHLDLLVTPVSGDGKQWVEQHRVDLSI